MSEASRQANLIARYEDLIFSQPGEEVPLTRLAELVRKRDGNLDQLLAEIEKKVAVAKDRYAALVAWGGILSHDDQVEPALEKLHEAAKVSPDRPEAWELIGALEKSRGNARASRDAYEKALPHAQGPERTILLRTLRDASLDIGDYDAASKHHRLLTKEASGNLYLQGELGRELLRRGQTERAVAELERVAQKARGDARALAPALKDLGEAQVAARKLEEGIATLKKASRLAVSSPGLRAAIDTIRAEAHRQDGSLPEFLKELNDSARTASRLALLGRLYEEAGSTEKAADAYKRALAQRPDDIDIRLRLVRLYELVGNIEGAVQEYGRLVKSSPRDVELSLRYAEMLLAQGKRAQAVAELDRIDRLTASDPDAGLLLLDFADRLEEKERSQRILARLARSKSPDARFLVELGSRYYQVGNTDAARRTWKRILDVSRNKAKGYRTYGEVLIDHEAATEGVVALRKAAELAPDDLGIQKALALGLERAAAQAVASSRHTYEKQALQAWQQLIDSEQAQSAPGAAQARSMARRHIVRLYKRMGKLAEALAPLERRLQADPPDLAAGRLLAEGYLALRADRRAIKTLEKILRHAPGDRSSLLQLEAAYSRAGNQEAAIAVLKKLVEADPRRAREYYERMARAAAAGNERKRALEFAELAVSKSPSDPAAQASLGDLYLAQGRLEQAESAYRKALSLDDRLHGVSLKLAEILTTTNRASEALEVLFHVLRGVSDADAVGLAARRAISISVPLSEQRKVEEALRPLAIAHPSRPQYRSLLLEVLSAQMYPLLLSAEHGTKEQRAGAKQQLRALADRSTGPLLSALSGSNAGEQQIAISLLAHGSTKGAGSGLLAFAEGSAQEDQRLMAVLALGKLDAQTLGARLSQLVAPDDVPRRGRIARAAVWVLSRSEQRRAVSTLLTAVEEGDPELRAYAALGLGDLAPEIPTNPSEIVEVLETAAAGVENGDVARSAAILALGRIVPSSSVAPSTKESVQRLLLDAETSPSSLIKRCALISLARISTSEEAQQRIASGLVSHDESVRRAATRAATLFASDRDSLEAWTLLPDDLDASQMDARSRVDDALSKADIPLRPELRHRALDALSEEITEEAVVALLSSAATAGAVLEQLKTVGGQTLFGNLLVARDFESEAPTTKTASMAAERIRSSLREEIVNLARGPQAELSRKAIGALRPIDGPEANEILHVKLRDRSLEVHQMALQSIVAGASPQSLDLLEQYLVDEDSWGRRRRVATALGSIVSEPPSSEVQSRAKRMLAELAKDASKFVRAEARARLEDAAD